MTARLGLAVGGAAFVVATLAARGGALLLLALMAAVVADAVLLRAAARTPRPADGGGWAPERFVEALTWCWLGVALVPAHDFSGRAPEAAATSVSVQALAEVLLFAAAGVVALAVLGALSTAAAATRVPLAAFAVPLWVMASTTWAHGTNAYALVRGIELAVLAALGWATAAVGRRSRDALDELVWAVLRGLVRIVVVLAGLGVVFGARFTAIGAYNRDRFTWPGAHPTMAGVLLSIAVVILGTAPGPALRMGPKQRGVLLAALLVALWANHSRAALAGLVVAAVVALWIGGRRHPSARALVLPYAAVATGLAAVVAWPAIYRYALRGGSTARLLTLNNRTELWDIGTAALRTAGDWALGLGYGSARVVFRPTAAFAGEAHNSALSLLVSLGVVGLGLLVALLAAVAARSWRLELVGTTSYGLTLVASLAFVVLHATTSDVLAEPGVGLSLLFLLAAVVSGPVDGQAAVRGRAEPRTEDAQR